MLWARVKGKFYPSIHALDVDMICLCIVRTMLWWDGLCLCIHFLTLLVLGCRPRPHLLQRSSISLRSTPAATSWSMKDAELDVGVSVRLVIYFLAVHALMPSRGDFTTLLIPEQKKVIAPQNTNLALTLSA